MRRKAFRAFRIQLPAALSPFAFIRVHSWAARPVGISEQLFPEKISGLFLTP
jgi:hypothetical protein